MVRVGLLADEVFGYCGLSADKVLAQNVPPTVTWDAGYPVFNNAPVFGTTGSIDVFGSYLSGAGTGNAGTATGATF